MKGEIVLLLSILVLLIMILEIVYGIYQIMSENNKKPTPTTKQICTNQEVWENRGSYPDFKCDMYNTKEGVVRECSTRKISFDKKNFTLVQGFLTTTCLEVCVENCS